MAVDLGRGRARMQIQASLAPGHNLHGMGSRVPPWLQPDPWNRWSGLPKDPGGLVRVPLEE